MTEEDANVAVEAVVVGYIELGTWLIRVSSRQRDTSRRQYFLAEIKGRPEPRYCSTEAGLGGKFADVGVSVISLA